LFGGFAVLFAGLSTYTIIAALAPGATPKRSRPTLRVPFGR
jgi:hypothetical protein